MNFKMEEAIEILERTPKTLQFFLCGISEEWLHCKEGKDTWNILEIVDHLIEAEQSNWMVRLAFILEEGENKPFPPFDRYRHLQEKSTIAIQQKLEEFQKLRLRNIECLKDLVNPQIHLEKKGFHPAFGVVKVRELISTWVVHDLTHIAQMVRVMAERYRFDVGPWIEYLGVLNKKV
ncbi:DinB family protein [Robertmurraya sp. DFI.2.37]|uniref:DinB family protein n=1 Tax=Robertmurraya sp. DFI.2.37 TaxID=3031819 RepID=UPI001247CDB8|nr:DinB family protein [Robertmurraya sp. DFI.2.37]MDF1507093.1 DinB family protein [Robertmurraya sp. DFI.2.37]